MSSNEPSNVSSVSRLPALALDPSIPAHASTRIATILNHSIESTTTASRRSAWRLWQNFIRIYPQAPELPSNPQWICVFLQHFFDSGYSSSSLITYLSHIGACYTQAGHQDWTTIRQHPLIRRLIDGMKKLEMIHRAPRQEPTLLTYGNILSTRVAESSLDHVLYNTILLCGFFGLHRLAELTDPDTFDPIVQSAKRIKLASVQFFTNTVQYSLPYHKGDRFGRSSIVVIQDATTRHTLQRYLQLRAHLKSPYLFIHADGTIPTKAWFLRILQYKVPNSSGKSLRRGGATAMAQAGATPQQIQEAGRWSSDAWKIYVRDHPALAAILRNRAHGL